MDLHGDLQDQMLINAINPVCMGDDNDDDDDKINGLYSTNLFTRTRSLEFSKRKS